MELNSPIIDLPKVGDITAAKLTKLGIKNVQDLLWHFPASYQDFSELSSVVELAPETTGTICGEIIRISSRRSFQKRLTIQEAMLQDDTGEIRAIWFNQPYLVKTLAKGVQFRFSGKVAKKNNALQMSSPTFERADMKTTHTGRLVPFYALTQGITHKLVRFWIRHALENVGEIPDPLPAQIRKDAKLMELAKAVKYMHFPENGKQHDTARQRIAFDELLTLQLHSELARQKTMRKKSLVVPFETNIIKEFVEKLPFELTADQRKASYEIVKDLEQPHPANRLLEGDVGSGKTVCAFLAMHSVVHAGFQSTLLAPTEILANQHFENAVKIFQPFGYSIGLLTSHTAKRNSEKDITKKELVKNVKDGDVDILVGTHAVIQQGVSFAKLAFSVVDEQQRFGVKQRSLIIEPKRGKHPHLLSMTATPIPRTLALVLYGELDLSIIRQMPKGRKAIKTYVVQPKKREDAYGFINKELDAGRQAFVIFPLIEESDKLRAKAATKEHGRLQKDAFPKWRVGLLHGRLKKEEKAATMKDFLEKKIDVLVSTSVVEVGVDIPNATVMMIENAERFGLAQLHQFRGRVGRGKHQSYCLLFSDSTSDDSTTRLKALEESNDGFKLAEKDLEIRGPGDVYGKVQSGYFEELRVARLSDHELIQKSQEYATKILHDDPHLSKNEALKNRLARFEDSVHFE